MPCLGRKKSPGSRIPQGFFALIIEERMMDRLYHVLEAQQFDLDLMDAIFAVLLCYFATLRFVFALFHPLKFVLFCLAFLFGFFSCFSPIRLCLRGPYFSCATELVAGC